MSRTAAHIGAPPIMPAEDTWQALVLTCAVTVLESVRRRPGRIATFTEDEFDTWRAAVRLHRDAWLQHMHDATGHAGDAYDKAEEQGRAAGWWVEDTLPSTLTIPLIDPREAADVLLHHDPDGGEAWAWALAKACRRVRQESA